MARRNKPRNQHKDTWDQLPMLLNILLYQNYLAWRESLKQKATDPPEDTKVVQLSFQVAAGKDLSDEDLDWLLEHQPEVKYCRNPADTRSQIAAIALKTQPGRRREQMAIHCLLEHLHNAELQAEDPGRTRLKLCDNCNMFFLTLRGRPQTKYCGQSCINSASVKRRKKAEEGGKKPRKKGGRKQ